MAVPVRRPAATTLKRLDYEEVRAFVAARHRVDDADFWSHITRDHEGTPRYIAVDIEQVLTQGGGTAVEFAGVLQKEYKDAAVVFDTRSRRRILAAKELETSPKGEV